MELIRRWLSRASPGPVAEAARWVVIDTETSGVDPARAALLAIGGVAVDATGIRAADSFEIVLRHTGSTDAANVALHGLGRDTLEGGAPAAEALNAFHAWIDGAPCSAFHADFDRIALERAATLAGVPPFTGPWLDLAPLAAALKPDVPRTGTGAFDDWLIAYGIECPGRHNAASDALAAAELLLRLRALAAEQGARGFAALAAIGRHRRWLGSSR